MAVSSMDHRTRFEAALAKRAAVTAAEAAGRVADSRNVRQGLMAKVHRGELTLGEAQQALKKIQAKATAEGKSTRARVFSES